MPPSHPLSILKIKFRESFRPFAPSVLEEHAAEYFVGAVKSPYMLFTFPIHPDKRVSLPADMAHMSGFSLLKAPRSVIPAVTHVDYSARIQTVNENVNPRYHRLISCFAKKTGCPVLINTSFNIRGEPIVCTPEDAWRCFVGTKIDYLVIGNYIVEKKDSDVPEHIEEWQKKLIAGD